MQEHEFGWRSRTAAEWRNGRRYVIEFAAGMAVLIGLSMAADRAGPALTGTVKIVVVLAPAIGSLVMAVAVARFVRRLDELQRATLLSAGGLAALATAVVTMSLGLLQDAHVVGVSMTIVLPMLALFWGIALLLVCRTQR